MAEALSQEEIDALRTAVRTGVALEGAASEQKPSMVAQVKVTEYDFKKPRLISLQDLKIHQMIHEAMSKSIQSSFFSVLKAAIEVKLVAVDQITYGEFVLSLSNPTHVGKVAVGQQQEQMAVEFSMPIAEAMIDILLGGDGTAHSDGRELTLLETGVFSAIVQQLTAELKAGWSTVSDVSFKWVSSESNPEYLQLATPETSCLGTTFDVKVGGSSGVINLCYPLLMLQGIFKKAAKGKAGPGGMDSSSDMFRAMDEVPITIHGILGATSMYARELGRLQPGDVLCMDKRIDTPALLAVDQSLMFNAAVGKRNGKVALKILNYMADPRVNGNGDKNGTARKQ